MKKTIKIYNEVNGNNNTIINNINIQTFEKEISIDQYTSDNISRTEQIVEQIKKFVKNHNNDLAKPCIRCYGLFSDLAMVNNILSDKSDRSMLLLEEKEIFKETIKENFLIKQIISLDVDFILNTRGYSIDKFNGRIEQLIGELKCYENKRNLQIVFDGEHQLWNTFILGNELLIDAIKIEKENGYTYTLFSKDPQKISNKIIKFDEIYKELIEQKRTLMKQLDLTQNYMICNQLVDSRKNSYFRKVNKIF